MIYLSEINAAYARGHCSMILIYIYRTMVLVKYCSYFVLIALKYICLNADLDRSLWIE